MNRVVKVFDKFIHKLRKMPSNNCTRMEISTDCVYLRTGDHVSKYIIETLLNLPDDNCKCSKSQKDAFSRFHRKVILEKDGGGLKKFKGYEKLVPFVVTPWDSFLKPFHEYHFTESYLEDYINRLLYLERRIVKEGYIPEKYGCISGVLLVNKRGDRRFIVYQGNRRAGVLSHLGYDAIKVELGGFTGGHDWVVKEEDVCDWVNVKNGTYTRKEALAYFGLFFKR